MAARKSGGATTNRPWFALSDADPFLSVYRAHSHRGLRVATAVSAAPRTYQRLSFLPAQLFPRRSLHGYADTFHQTRISTARAVPEPEETPGLGLGSSCVDLFRRGL